MAAKLEILKTLEICFMNEVMAGSFRDNILVSVNQSSLEAQSLRLK